MVTFNSNLLQTLLYLIVGVLLSGGVINFIGLHKINKKLFLWGEGLSIFSICMLSFYTIICFYPLPGYISIFIAFFSLSLFLSYRFIKNNILFKGQFWFNEKLLVKFPPNCSFKWQKQIIHLDVDRLCRVEHCKMEKGKPFYAIVILNIKGKPRFYCEIKNGNPIYRAVISYIKGKPRFDDVPEEYLRRP